MSNAQSPQDYFKSILLTVVGQAFNAAGYTLVDRPVQQASGQFEFMRDLGDGLYGFITYQVLIYVDTEWAARTPSRFQVTLTRSDQPHPRAASHHPAFIRRELGALVVEDFGVGILPGAKHWWTFQNVDEMGKALAEAGHLVIGYGIPWLAGDLTPPSAK